MSKKLNSEIAVIGIDIGKNSFHLVGQDRQGALVLRQKWSRGQVEARLANLPPCLIGMEAHNSCRFMARARETDPFAAATDTSAPTESPISFWRIRGGFRKARGEFLFDGEFFLAYCRANSFLANSGRICFGKLRGARWPGSKRAFRSSETASCARDGDVVLFSVFFLVFLAPSRG